MEDDAGPPDEVGDHLFYYLSPTQVTTVSMVYYTSVSHHTTTNTIYNHVILVLKL